MPVLKRFVQNTDSFTNETPLDEAGLFWSHATCERKVELFHGLRPCDICQLIVNGEPVRVSLKKYHILVVFIWKTRAAGLWRLSKSFRNQQCDSKYVDYTADSLLAGCLIASGLPAGQTSLMYSACFFWNWLNSYMTYLDHKLCFTFCVCISSKIWTV